MKCHLSASPSIVRRTATKAATVPAIVALSPGVRPPDESPFPANSELLTVCVGVDTLPVMGVPELIEAADVVDKGDDGDCLKRNSKSALTDSSIFFFPEWQISQWKTVGIICQLFGVYIHRASKVCRIQEARKEAQESLEVLIKRYNAPPSGPSLLELPT
jgi:hypothetical protein